MNTDRSPLYSEHLHTHILSSMQIMSLALKLLMRTLWKIKIVFRVADLHRSHWKFQSGFSCQNVRQPVRMLAWLSSGWTLHILSAYRTWMSGGMEEAILESVSNFLHNILGRRWKPTRVRSYCRTALATEKFLCRGRSPSGTRTLFYPWNNVEQVYSLNEMCKVSSSHLFINILTLTRISSTPVTVHMDAPSSGWDRIMC